MAIVGEAEVLIVANTTGLEAQLAGLGAVGEEAGGSLRSGVTKETDKLGSDLGDAGLLAGSNLKGGLTKGTEGIAKDATKAVETETTKMQQLLKASGDKAKSTLSSFGVPQSLLTGYGAAALGIGAIGAVSIKLASDMQSADASIATSAGESVKAATSIGDAFLATAGQSEFSGIKQAQAFAQVAGQLKATEGQALSTAQAQTFMKTSTDLATASGEDLSAVTSTLGGVMQAFQIPVKGAADAADVLFNASRETGEGIDTLASSVERVKGRLGDLAPSVASLSALMVDLTKNGITGRGALTALQGSYTALAGAATGTSKANLLAKQTLADYGIQVVNAAGKLTPMSTIIQKLAPQFATMTQQQQLATATTIFGASAAKQMTAVIDAGTQSYNNATQAVNKHNTVTDAATTKAQTLSGETHILVSAISDEGTQLGSVLVPALTAVVGAVLPVVKGFVDLIGWFEKGSAEAHVVEGVIVAVLAPALIKMGTDATVAAAKAVAGFVTMRGSAATTATSIGVSETEAGTAVEGFGTTVESTNTAIIASNEKVATSFTGLAGKAGAAGIVITGLYDTYKSIKNPSLIGQGGFLDKVLGNGQTNSLKGASTVSVEGVGKDSGKYFTITTAQIKALNDNATTTKEFNTDLVKLADLDKNPSKNKGAITQLLNALTGPQLSGSISQAIKGALPDEGKGTQTKGKGKDTYIDTSGGATATSMSALASKVTEALSLPANEAITSLKALGVPAAKAAQVLKDAALPFGQAITALEKEGFNATEAVSIAESATRKSTSSAKSAATKSEEDAKKAAAAATKAQNTFVSEVLKAVTLPAGQGEQQLRALGVPASKAAAVLKDAVEPFADAVKALEKTGIDASNAVKIADAGRKVVEAQQKAAAAAAKKAGDAAATASNLSGVTVNGIQVSGAVYDAAIGSAYKNQTGQALSSTGPSSTATPSSYGAVGGPTSPAGSAGVTFQSGSIVINPAPGNDAASLLATQGMIAEMLQQMTNEISNTPSPLGSVIG